MVEHRTLNPDIEVRTLDPEPKTMIEVDMDSFNPYGLGVESLDFSVHAGLLSSLNSTVASIKASPEYQTMVWPPDVLERMRSIVHGPNDLRYIHWADAALLAYLIYLDEQNYGEAEAIALLTEGAPRNLLYATRYARYLYNSKFRML